MPSANDNIISKSNLAPPPVLLWSHDVFGKKGEARKLANSFKFVCNTIHPLVKKELVRQEKSDLFKCPHPGCGTVVSGHMAGWCWVRAFSSDTVPCLGPFPQADSLWEYYDRCHEKVTMATAWNGVIHLTSVRGDQVALTDLLTQYPSFKMGARRTKASTLAFKAVAKEIRADAKTAGFSREGLPLSKCKVCTNFRCNGVHLMTQCKFCGDEMTKSALTKHIPMCDGETGEADEEDCHGVAPAITSGSVKVKFGFFEDGPVPYSDPIVVPKATMPYFFGSVEIATKPSFPVDWVNPKPTREMPRASRPVKPMKPVMSKVQQEFVLLSTGYLTRMGERLRRKTFVNPASFITTAFPEAEAWCDLLHLVALTMKVHVDDRETTCLLTKFDRTITTVRYGGRSVLCVTLRCKAGHIHGTQVAGDAPSRALTPRTITAERRLVHEARKARRVPPKAVADYDHVILDDAILMNKILLPEIIQEARARQGPCYESVASKASPQTPVYVFVDRKNPRSRANHISVTPFTVGGARGEKMAFSVFQENFMPWCTVFSKVVVPAGEAATLPKCRRLVYTADPPFVINRIENTFEAGNGKVRAMHIGDKVSGSSPIYPTLVVEDTNEFRPMFVSSANIDAIIWYKSGEPIGEDWSKDVLQAQRTGVEEANPSVLNAPAVASLFRIKEGDLKFIDDLRYGVVECPECLETLFINGLGPVVTTVASTCSSNHVLSASLTSYRYDLIVRRVGSGWRAVRAPKPIASLPKDRDVILNSTPGQSIVLRSGIRRWRYVWDGLQLKFANMATEDLGPNVEHPAQYEYDPQARLDRELVPPTLGSWFYNGSSSATRLYGNPGEDGRYKPIPLGFMSAYDDSVDHAARQGPCYWALASRLDVFDSTIIYVAIDTDEPHSDENHIALEAFEDSRRGVTVTSMTFGEFKDAIMPGCTVNALRVGTWKDWCPLGWRALTESESDGGTIAVAAAPGQILSVKDRVVVSSNGDFSLFCVADTAPTKRAVSGYDELLYIDPSSDDVFRLHSDHAGARAFVTDLKLATFPDDDWEVYSKFITENRVLSTSLEAAVCQNRALQAAHIHATELAESRLAKQTSANTRLNGDLATALTENKRLKAESYSVSTLKTQVSQLQVQLAAANRAKDEALAHPSLDPNRDITVNERPGQFVVLRFGVKRWRYVWDGLQLAFAKNPKQQLGPHGPTPDQYEYDPNSNKDRQLQPPDNGGGWFFNGSSAATRLYGAPGDPERYRNVMMLNFSKQDASLAVTRPCDKYNFGPIYEAALKEAGGETRIRTLIKRCPLVFEESKWFALRMHCCGTKASIDWAFDTLVIGEFGDYYVVAWYSSYPDGSREEPCLSLQLKWHDPYQSHAFTVDTVQGAPHRLSWPDHHHVHIAKPADWAGVALTAGDQCVADQFYQDLLSRNVRHRHDYRDRGFMTETEQRAAMEFIETCPASPVIKGHKTVIRMPEIVEMPDDSGKTLLWKVFPHLFACPWHEDAGGYEKDKVEWIASNASNRLVLLAPGLNEFEASYRGCFGLRPPPNTRSFHPVDRSAQIAIAVSQFQEFAEFSAFLEHAISVYNSVFATEHKVPIEIRYCKRCGEMCRYPDNQLFEVINGKCVCGMLLSTRTITPSPDRNIQTSREYMEAPTGALSQSPPVKVAHAKFFGVPSVTSESIADMFKSVKAPLPGRMGIIYLMACSAVGVAAYKHAELGLIVAQGSQPVFHMLNGTFINEGMKVNINIAPHLSIDLTWVGEVAKAIASSFSEIMITLRHVLALTSLLPVLPWLVWMAILVGCFLLFLFLFASHVPLPLELEDNPNGLFTESLEECGPREEPTNTPVSEQFLVACLGTWGDYICPKAYARLAAWAGVRTHLWWIHKASLDELDELAKGNMLPLATSYVDLKTSWMNGYKYVFNPHTNLSMRGTSYSMSPSNKWIKDIEYQGEGEMNKTYLSIFAEMLSRYFWPSLKIGILNDCNLPRSTDGKTWLVPNQKPKKAPGKQVWCVGSGSTDKIPADVRAKYPQLEVPYHDSALDDVEVAHILGGAGLVQTCLAKNVKVVIYDSRMDRNYINKTRVRQWGGPGDVEDVLHLTQKDLKMPSADLFFGMLIDRGFNLSLKLNAYQRGMSWLKWKWHQRISFVRNFLLHVARIYAVMSFVTKYHSLYFAAIVSIPFAFEAANSKAGYVVGQWMLSTIWSFPILMALSTKWMIFTMLLLVSGAGNKLLFEMNNWHKNRTSLIIRPVKQFPMPFGHFQLRDNRTGEIFEGRHIERDGFLEKFTWVARKANSFGLKHGKSLVIPMPFSPQLLKDRIKHQPKVGAYTAFFNCHTITIQEASNFGMIGPMILFFVFFVSLCVLLPGELMARACRTFNIRLFGTHLTDYMAFAAAGPEGEPEETDAAESSTSAKPPLEMDDRVQDSRDAHQGTVDDHVKGKAKKDVPPLDHDYCPHGFRYECMAPEQCDHLTSCCSFLGSHCCFNCGCGHSHDCDGGYVSDIEEEGEGVYSPLTQAMMDNPESGPFTRATEDVANPSFSLPSVFAKVKEKEVEERIARNPQTEPTLKLDEISALEALALLPKRQGPAPISLQEAVDMFKEEQAEKDFNVSTYGTSVVEDFFSPKRIPFKNFLEQLASVGIFFRSQGLPEEEVFDLFDKMIFWNVNIREEEDIQRDEALVPKELSHENDQLYLAALPLEAKDRWIVIIEQLERGLRQIYHLPWVADFFIWFKQIFNNVKDFLRPITDCLFWAMRITYQLTGRISMGIWHAMLTLMDTWWGTAWGKRAKAAWALSALHKVPQASLVHRMRANMAMMTLEKRTSPVETINRAINRFETAARKEGLEGVTIGGRQERNLKWKNQVLYPEAAAMLGFNTDPSLNVTADDTNLMPPRGGKVPTLDEFDKTATLDRTWVNVERVNERIGKYIDPDGPFKAPLGGDGVLLGQLNPERIRDSLERYAPLVSEISAEDRRRAVEAADAMFRKFPEAYAKMEMTTFKGALNYVKWKYSAGALLLKYGSRQALRDAGFDPVFYRLIMDQMESGRYDTVLMHAFEKSQVVDLKKMVPEQISEEDWLKLPEEIRNDPAKQYLRLAALPKNLRTIVSPWLPVIVGNQMVELLRNKRITWETTGAGMGLTLNQTILTLFSRFRDRVCREGGMYFDADASEFDSRCNQRTTTSLGQLARRGYDNFLDPIGGAAAASYLQCSYDAEMDAYMFAITERKNDCVALGVPNQEDRNHLLTSMPWLFSAKPKKHMVFLPEDFSTVRYEHKDIPVAGVFVREADLEGEMPKMHITERNVKGKVVRNQKFSFFTFDTPYEVQEAAVEWAKGYADWSRVDSNGQPIVVWNPYTDNVLAKNVGMSTGGSATSWNNTHGFRATFLQGLSIYFDDEYTMDELLEMFDFVNTGDDTTGAFIMSMKLKKAFESKVLAATGKVFDHGKMRAAMKSVGLWLELNMYDDFYEMQYLGKHVRRATDEDIAVLKLWQQKESKRTGFEPKIPRDVIYQGLGPIFGRKAGQRYYQATYGPDYDQMMLNKLTREPTRWAHAAARDQGLKPGTVEYQRVYVKELKTRLDVDKRPVFNTYQFNAIATTCGHAMVSAFIPEAYKEFALEYIEDMNLLLAHFALPGRYHWDETGDLPSVAFRGGGAIVLSPAQHAFMKWRRGHPFPKYEQVIKVHMQEGPKAEDRYAKFMAKISKKGAYPFDESIAFVVDIFADWAEMIPRQWYKIQPALAGAHQERAFNTRHRWIEEATFKLNPGLETIGDLSAVTSEGAFNVCTNSGAFWHEYHTIPSIKKAVDDRPYYVSQNMVITAMLIYGTQYWLEKVLMTVPFLGITYRLFLFLTIDMNKVYGLLSAIAWVGMMRASRELAAIQSRDPYRYSKQFAVFVVDQFPEWWGWIMRMDLIFALFPQLIDVVGRFLAKGIENRAFAQPGGPKDNPWYEDARNWLTDAQTFREEGLDYRGLVFSPTATGKSTWFIWALLSMGRGRPAAIPGATTKPLDVRRIWLVSPTLILRDTWGNPCPEVCRPQILEAGVRIGAYANVLLCTYGHFIQRYHDFREGDIFVLDEFHIQEGEMIISSLDLSESLETRFATPFVNDKRPSKKTDLSPSDDPDVKAKQAQWKALPNTIFFLTATPPKMMPDVGQVETCQASPNVKQRHGKDIFEVDADVSALFQMAQKRYPEECKRALITVPTNVEMPALRERIQNLMPGTLITCVNAAQRVIPETGIIIGNAKFIGTGVDIRPAAEILISSGRIRRFHKGQEVREKNGKIPAMNPDECKQEEGRVGRLKHGIVFRPRWAGKGIHAVAYPSGGRFTHQGMAEYLKMPALMPIEKPCTELWPYVSFSEGGDELIRKTAVSLVGHRPDQVPTAQVEQELRKGLTFVSLLAFGGVAPGEYLKWWVHWFGEGKKMPQEYKEVERAMAVFDRTMTLSFPSIQLIAMRRPYKYNLGGTPTEAGVIYPVCDEWRESSAMQGATFHVIEDPINLEDAFANKPSIADQERLRAWEKEMASIFLKLRCKCGATKNSNLAVCDMCAQRQDGGSNDMTGKISARRAWAQARDLVKNLKMSELANMGVHLG